MGVDQTREELREQPPTFYEPPPAEVLAVVDGFFKWRVANRSRTSPQDTELEDLPPDGNQENLRTRLRPRGLSFACRLCEQTASPFTAIVADLDLSQKRIAFLQFVGKGGDLLVREKQRSHEHTALA